MLDEFHVDVSGQQGELHCAQFVEGSSLPAAARRDRLVPHRGHFLAERFVLDLHQTRKKLRDFANAIILLGRHDDCRFSRWNAISERVVKTKSCSDQTFEPLRGSNSPSSSEISIHRSVSSCSAFYSILWRL